MELAQPRIDPTAFVAPTATVLGDVSLESHTVVMFGAVLRSEEDRITVGERTNVQDNAVLHTDAGSPCAVGASVTIGHSAVVHGATVGDHCLIGIGAVVLNGSAMGEGAWIAAGSVLPEGHRIPDWTLAVGSPARIVRELTPDEIERQSHGVETYQQLAARYRQL